MAPAIEPVELAFGALLLRPPDEVDAVDALAMVRDPDTARWNPAPAIVDVARARDWCKRLADWSGGDHATFSVLDADSGRLLGNVSLHKIDRVESTAEMGYRVGPWARDRGVATGAVRLVTEWAFARLGLHRVQLYHAVANPASCRVAEKCGYLVEGTLRSAAVYGDGLRYDEHVHGRLAGSAP